MLKKSFRNRCLNSISALLSASALAMVMGLSQPVQASEPFIAEIVMFGGNFAPRNWALCDGQLLQVSENQALFALLGTTYGGDGRTTFALPDLRGRTAIHPGTGPGLSSYRLGERGGVESVVLSAAQMPSHTHTATTTVDVSDLAATARASTGNAETKNPAGTVWSAQNKIYTTQTPDVEMSPAAIQISASGASAATTVGATGGGQAHENRMPFLAINHIIALQGVFPSRQ